MAASVIEYTGSFTVSEDTVVNAIALKTGLLRSSVATEEYVCSWDIYAQMPSTDAEGTYLIGTPEELAWFAGLVNGTLNGFGQNRSANARLTADISLSAHIWLGIGGNYLAYGSSVAYIGVFDGDGYTIGGLRFPESDCPGLFWSNGGVIKNVGLTGDDISIDDTNFGGICDVNIGTISNCYNECDISLSYSYSATSLKSNLGGICADNRNGGIIEYCYNTGTIVAESAGNVGGIAGANSGTVRYCYNSGTFTWRVNQAKCWGGIVGCLYEGGAISHCYNTGMLTMGGHVNIAYSDIGGWQGSSGGNCGTMTGWPVSGNAGTVTDSYYLKDISLKGDALDNVALMDLFRAYTSVHSNNSVSIGGWQSGSSSAKDNIDTDDIYYAFYDATNDQIIALKLEGEGGREQRGDRRGKPG